MACIPPSSAELQPKRQAGTAMAARTKSESTPSEALSASVRRLQARTEALGARTRALETSSERLRAATKRLREKTTRLEEEVHRKSDFPPAATGDGEDEDLDEVV
jgi:hypothetical protein